ncbi:MAG: ABC transporter ATP-binding protein [Thermus sp.]|uniref:ABC transporter ATP-binding protein n=1 Tax=unclassified Thermus TaxID=2619321 RepID=UPI000238A3E5|nr:MULTISPECIES: ABC transporter ATP-binding protein [unclassified Thermus]AEV16293.1 ABC transporter protein [Thermus sp. CCB_US3_UF1]MCS6867303.1 ABC transporter ATP-binding protein [Thermus sp.]MCS7218988.1 ABC transporter ATP-binding protein [Thermus sp.]MCX7850374.1 ABC transporter ATP-binding protein [Thermus sp.]MDW8358288.1 ABC transporter ATP-binding protein [Thermus sp.]
MPILEARNVRKVYRGDGVETEALRGVSLAVEAGEFTALVGPSGSGKSTLLHLLAGLDLPTEGEVWVGGVRLDRLSRSQRARFRLEKVGLVFQAYNLLPVLTALENAAFVLELRGLPRAERERRAWEALAALGLADKAGRFPRQLSGGEQQRVAVARALAAEPLIVLADEPTANLDSRNGLALIERMKALNEARGVTFLFSTHDPRLLEHVKRIVRLEDGRVVGEEHA